MPRYAGLKRHTKRSNWVLFTGMPVGYKNKLLVAFGDYIEAYKVTDNTLRAHSSACIALYSASGS